MLLTEAIEALAIATRADGRSSRTVGSYREKLKPLLAFLGDVAVEEISIDDLRRYIAQLMDRSTRYSDHPVHQEQEGGLSPYTVSGRVRALKRLFNFLKDEGVLEINPARRIKVPRPKQREPKGVATRDMLALIETTKGGSVIDLRDRAIILFLADTACRVGGLCNLEVQDLDLDASRAAINEKGDRTRLALFNEPTAKALGAWLEVRPEDKGPWVFIGLGNHSKGPMSANGVLQAIRRRAEEAGVTGPVNPHAFRHAFARDSLLDGGDLAALADIMGHSSVEVTHRYYAVFKIRELQEKHRRHSPVARLFGGDENG